MEKGRSQPVVWLLLSRGKRPKEIIALGYTTSVVYKYHALWPEIKAELKEALKKLKELEKKK